MSTTAGIVGAGLAGRLLGVTLGRLGWRVTLFDKDDENARQSCSWTGAGMIAPYCEQESAEPIICALGLRSLELWPQVLPQLAAPVFYQQTGSIVVAHPHDEPELWRLQREVASRGTSAQDMQVLAGADLATLEPELGGRFQRGLFFPHEAQVDNWQLLPALAATLKAQGATWHAHTEVAALAPGVVRVGAREEHFDWVLDCRGMGASADLPTLRGVRGELVHVRAPEVKLTRPVRMMHPRYPLYIVPRPDDRYVIGATKIESYDLSPISVRGALELLSAAYALHPGFCEGRIIETDAHCRPAMPNNLPLVAIRPGLVRVNGMFRHGFLLSPALVEGVVSYFTNGRVTELVGRIAQVAG